MKTTSDPPSKTAPVVECSDWVAGDKPPETGYYLVTLIMGQELWGEIGLDELGLCDADIFVAELWFKNDGRWFKTREHLGDHGPGVLDEIYDKIIAYKAMPAPYSQPATKQI